MMSIITKRSWKIRFSFIFVFIPVFLFLSACSLRHTSPLPLNESVVHLLEIMGYHDCNILSLADYETLATQYEVSNEELESRVQELFRQNPIEIKSDRKEGISDENHLWQKSNFRSFINYDAGMHRTYFRFCSRQFF